MSGKGVPTGTTQRVNARELFAGLDTRAQLAKERSPHGTAFADGTTAGMAR